ncbi:MAG TPA: hypothetical protein DIS96_10370 [Pusillimonas sp.]|nr:hypothetical protein [Pusillimonas sp.]
MILTIEKARAHCRVDGDYPADQLTPYMEAAERFVIDYLNRAVYADQSTLDTAQDGLPGSMATAFDDYEASIEAAKAIDNCGQRQTMIDLASEKYRRVQRETWLVINGMVVNKTIEAAMLLVLGNLFANRESDLVGVSGEKLPTGVHDLLRPYRLVQMP